MLQQSAAGTPPAHPHVVLNDENRYPQKELDRNLGRGVPLTQQNLDPVQDTKM